MGGQLHAEGAPSSQTHTTHRFTWKSPACPAPLPSGSFVLPSSAKVSVRGALCSWAWKARSGQRRDPPTSAGIAGSVTSDPVAQTLKPSFPPCSLLGPVPGPGRVSRAAAPGQQVRGRSRPAGHGARGTHCTSPLSGVFRPSRSPARCSRSPPLPLRVNGAPATPLPLSTPAQGGGSRRPRLGRGWGAPSTSGRRPARPRLAAPPGGLTATLTRAPAPRAGRPGASAGSPRGSCAPL